jgi:hypothetical protein
MNLTRKTWVDTKWSRVWQLRRVLSWNKTLPDAYRKSGSAIHFVPSTFCVVYYFLNLPSSILSRGRPFVSVILSAAPLPRSFEPSNSLTSDSAWIWFLLSQVNKTCPTRELLKLKSLSPWRICEWWITQIWVNRKLVNPLKHKINLNTRYST